MLNSVEEFHSRIEELELDQEDRLITADVKDFFVVGDHWYLAKMAASILEPKDRNLMERVILFLLRNQFVTSTLCESGRIFQVEQGSGIGFVASGEISDSVFLAVMERQYILKQEVRQERHIKAYFRYRDDIFLIARGGNGNLGTLAKHWKHVAISYKSPYLIEGWVVSSESVVYLDTELYKGPRWKTVRKLDSRTHTKPSSLCVPLSPLSSHPKWVHNWWPLGEIRRFARRSTQHKEFIKTRDRFIERLERYNYDETVINKCKNLEFTKRPGVNLGKVKSKGETTWCVFEHHPVLSRANVQRVINRWSQTWSEAIRYHCIPNVRVAWRIGLKPLVVRLRSNAARAIQNLRESK